MYHPFINLTKHIFPQAFRRVEDFLEAIEAEELQGSTWLGSNSSKSPRTSGEKLCNKILFPGPPKHPLPSEESPESFAPPPPLLQILPVESGTK
ncbi:hypothetical protein Mgra_00000741 [Meloidogyne graminicola]|uniref:Uncharacterized protein n=1 Tax=Meloidogyne graminicola TaxID=189291 RepID=A0A8T0A183_9BILA|nr:hypothetical protein Mgra_00000741 [Meloidogyne graminicola]